MELSEEEVMGYLQTVNEEFEFNFPEIKKEQQQVITSILNGKDTVCILPTGFGKSFCIVAPLLIKKKVHPHLQHTTVVVSPLLALMKDQVLSFREHGVRATMLSSSMSQQEIKEIRDGRVEIIFTSPETIMSDKWRRIIPKVYGKQLLCVVYDEAHCISEWGLEFRPDYKKVCELQNILVATTLVLTATATEDILKDIEKDLCLSAYNIVSSLPNRANIFLAKETIVEKFDSLHWIADHVRENGANSKKILIFVNYVLSTADVFEYLEDELGDHAFVNHQPSSGNRMIEMYSAGTDPKDQERVQKRVKEKDGTLRVVVATIAFGLGIDIPDVDIVIQWGLPRSPLQFWQEVGRAGRDGRRALSLSYIFKRSVNLCESEKMKTFALEDSVCLRHKVLKNFCLNDNMLSQLERLPPNEGCSSECKDTNATTCCCYNCLCCTVCMQKCPFKMSSVVDGFLKL